MGEVWEAWHTTLGIPVAVKLLKRTKDPHGASRALDRFRTEARLAARLSHPSIVRVLDFGEEGCPHLVMELVRGPDLQTWISRWGSIDELTALKVAGHVAVGLAAMHRCGVVHRDLKPFNILVAQGRAIKIADLGLARSPGDSRGEEPLSGTPHYMAPECLGAAASTDPRSDLYSLGVILYRMLFGRLPFSGGVAEVLDAQLRKRPDWTVPHGLSIDGGTLYVARRLLEKDPERRIRSALELVQACREQVGRMEARVAMPTPAPRAVVTVESDSVEPDETQKTSSSGWKWTLWICWGISLAACGYLAGRLGIRP